MKTITMEEAIWAIERDWARIQKAGGSGPSKQPSDESIIMVQQQAQRWFSAKRKLGRWVYCKYCNKNVRPEIGPDFSIIICTECQAGIALAKDYCHAS